MLDDKAVGSHQTAADPAQQTTADPHNHGETIQKLEHHLAAEHNKRHRNQKAENNQHRLVVIVGLLRRSRNSNYVVETHHEVGHDDRLDRP